MIDLESYRAGIGTFLNNRISYNGRFCYYKKRGFSVHIVYHKIFIKVFSVLCLFNLTLLLLTKDPAIEWNLGPGNYQKIIFTSDQEKKLFQCLRSINNDIAHISSHQQFMADSKELK